MSNQEQYDATNGVAIIGLAGRFPGAKTAAEFWRNLKAGVEGVSFFTDDELRAEGIAPEVLSDPGYVKAKAMLEDIEWFDAAFFGITPKEAEMMDPQQRLFLECAWAALEDAGYDSEQYSGAIGLYAGSSINSYLMLNLFSNPGLVDTGSILQTSIPNRTDHLTTRGAYKLNLKGPAVTVQTACSTSLVAVHLACHSLMGYQCDIALAGGVTISVPKNSGYYFQEGGVVSPDGHCRAFDQGANGTVPGNGVGVVVLKRLAEALADGDEIHAVIKGSAINNDGSLKVGYTAPSVNGQADVIALAQVVAGVTPDTISYVEAHGTGTTLGDPIEIAALTQVFRAGTDKKNFCAIGSVKTNIGHLDVASGVASLIKTTLALKEGVIPPLINFERAGTDIDIAGGPFYFNDKAIEWKRNGGPRRAGVSSFGIGGTNAHVILEEAPPRADSAPSRPSQLLVLSARTGAALETATANLSFHLKEHPEPNLADVAYTLAAGRRAFKHRRIVVSHDPEDAANVLETLDPRRVLAGLQEPKNHPVMFMFPGQGAQHARMGRELYEAEVTYRSVVDSCAELLQPLLGLDLREVLYPQDELLAQSEAQLKQTFITQPALFVTEYALAKQWLEWGVNPQAMIGHSIGEYVAACLAEVLSLEDALALVAARGRLMQGAEGGEMLAVALPEDEAVALLGDNLSLASVNTPAQCVLAGSVEAVAELEAKLKARDVWCRRLQTSHAFHSHMMDPILDAFRAEVKKVALNEPRIPYVSNLTGAWISAAEATDPEYWVSHVRQTIRFSEGVARLFEEPDTILLEVGPGKALMTIARWHPAKTSGQTVLTSLPQPEEKVSELASVQNTLGKLWLAGVPVDWQTYYAHEQRRRVSLPTYPFERRRFWIEPQQQLLDVSAGQKSLRKQANVTDWFYIPSWTSSAPPALLESRVVKQQDTFWLLFVDESGLGSRLAHRLEAAGNEVATVSAGKRFAEHNEREFTVAPGRKEDFDALLTALSTRGKRPTNIVHLWNVMPEFDSLSEHALAEECQRRGFYTLLALAQSFGEQAEEKPLDLVVITNNMQRVTGDETLCPEKATVLGPCRVVPQEYKHINSRSLDVTLPAADAEREKLAELLVAELFAVSPEKVVAYRNQQRWTQSFERHGFETPARQGARVREKGVYLITGGLGGLGLVFAEHLAKTAGARLALVGRSALPTREHWARWVSTHDEQDPVSRKIRHLEELEKHGARVESYSADVADSEQMRGVLAQVKERFGPVNGVIHAAGVPGGGMVQLKTAENAAAILAPKVNGTRVLGELFEDSRLDFMLLCSSRSSILGGFGQIDYCAANAFLDAFAHYYTARTGTFTVSVDWDGWQEVGMLVNTAAHYGVGDKAATSSYEKLDHPLLEKMTVESDGRETYLAEVSVSDTWILEEHRIGGKAVLPGVAYIEMGRAAFEHHAGSGPVELRDIFFITPMSLGDDERRELRLQLEQNGEGFKFRASSSLISDDGANRQWQDHAIGEVGRATVRPPRRHDLSEIAARCNVREFVVGDEENDPDLGPRWQNLKKVHLGERELLVLFELAEEFEHDLQQLKLHPSLLDRAAGTGMLYRELGSIYLPMSYKRLRFDHALPRRIYAYIKETENNYSKKETITFDVIVMDEDGVELVEIEEFSEKRINDLTEQVRARGGQEGRAHEAVSAPADKTEKNLYEESIGDGITSGEGVEVFKRILAAATVPQVIVSTRDLAASIARANAFTDERLAVELDKIQPARPLHPRPEVGTPYAAPRNDVEGMLAGIMQEALGLDHVGINDNFFELGGDSVLSIQIIARVNRAGWHITPQQIFQHQTIAELAEVAVKAPGAGAESPAAPVKEDTPVKPVFELGEIQGRKLDTLAMLLDDDEESDSHEEVDPVVDEPTIVPSASRVRAGEVESTLLQHPSVSEAAVVARGGNGHDDLVAYVVLDGGRIRTAEMKKMGFSLFYFAADNSRVGEDKYRLYLEGAQYADRHGFEAIWTPERHFHESGGLYPNPSILSAALAVTTEQIKLRAGSVVLPLHHSIRVAEEWSVIDNLSRGRVGLSFTTGWIPNDFAFFPERYANKREELFRGIEEVQRLWRGQTITARDGAGNSCELKILPRPLQPELPIWLTCSGDPQMFTKAGELGLNVLTALLSQSVDEVAGKLELYRQARAKHGHDPDGGHITVMMHTFVGPDESVVLDNVRAPLREYLKTHIGLIETMTQSLDIKIDIDKEQYLEYLLDFAFERYYQTASLIGTPDKCMAMVKRLSEIGVNEIASFVDFGVEVGQVLDGLHHLNALKKLSDDSHVALGAAKGQKTPETLRALNRFVREKLPQHTKDTSFVVLDLLPVTPQGTVDYRALPAA